MIDTRNICHDALLMCVFEKFWPQQENYSVLQA